MTEPIRTPRGGAAESSRRIRRRSKGKQKTVDDSTDSQPLHDESESLGTEPNSIAQEPHQRHKAKYVQEASYSGPTSSPAGQLINITKQPEASSSKLPPSSSRPTEQPGSRKKRLRAPKREKKEDLAGQPPAKKTRTKKGKARGTEHYLPSSTENGKKKAAEEDELSIPTWECVPLVQNVVLRVPPIWSKDGRFYFTVTNTSIHVHSSTPPTFSQLSTLCSTHPEGHRKSITSLLLSPLNPFQLITSSEDGTVKIWDWSEGRLIRTVEMYDVPCSVRQICVGEAVGNWWIFAAITHERVRDDMTARQQMKMDKKRSKGIIEYRHHVLRVPLVPSSNPSGYVVGRTSGTPAAIFLSPRSTYLVTLAGSKAYTFRLPKTPSQGADPDKWKPTLIKFVSDQPFTCGAFSPERTIGGRTSEEEWFATGDSRGIIRLWHGLAAAFRQLDDVIARTPGHDPVANPPDIEKRLPTTSLHWHAHTVAAIAFTPSGAQLLSVGEESVLVQWHLASGKREYIPRLGGTPILSLGVKRGSRGVEEEWWLGFADGSVVRVGAASGSVSTVGQAARLDPLRAVSDSIPYPLAIHPASGSLVIPSSHPSTLQFVDPTASTVLFNLEVAPSNRNSRRDDKELEPIAVEQVAFSDVKDGESRWMATMEGRKGDEVEGGGMVKNLKIWRWDGVKYVVNNQFPRPHGMSDISKIAFSPLRTASQASPYLLTTAMDGTAKLWEIRQAKKSEQGKTATRKPTAVELFWSTRSSFDYRSMPIFSAAFSPDGTIVALAHGVLITLWDVESNVLLKVLNNAIIDDAMKVAFAGLEGRYLVVGGKSSGIIVWDLLSCEVSWTCTSIRCEILLAPGSATTFLSAYNHSSERTVVSVFSPTNPTPAHQHLVKAGIKEMTVLPSTTASSLHLIGIGKNGEIYRFGDNITSAASQAVRVSGQTTFAKPLSIWQEMFGKDAFLEDLKTVPDTAPPPRIRKIGRPSEVFDGPSHTLPPVGLLFDAFMDELLSEKSPVRKEDESTAVDGIIYDGTTTPAPVSTASAVGSNKIRPVTDEAVRDLEVFFRGLLTAKPASTTASGKKVNSLPNGYSHMANGDTPTQNPRAHLIVNGISADGGGSMEDPTSPAEATKSLPNGDGIKSAAEDREDKEREVAVTDSDRKKRSRKRRAPLES